MTKYFQNTNIFRENPKFRRRSKPGVPPFFNHACIQRKEKKACTTVKSVTNQLKELRKNEDRDYRVNSWGDRSNYLAQITSENLEKKPRIW